MFNPLKIIFEATGFAQNITLEVGFYKFELFGASGGSGKRKGGRGGYVSGNILIKQKIDIFVYVGIEGTKNDNIRFGGGGNGGINTGYTGGGSTDIRIINSNDFYGLASRIIVASGGGGSDSYESGCDGGHGGGIIGSDGNFVRHVGMYDEVVPPTGGTQYSPGQGGYPLYYDASYFGFPGAFGVGGNSHHGWGGGGGGGYFGGGGGCDAPWATSSGAGGSSYISGHPDCRAVDPTSPSPIKMLQSSIHYSGLSFENSTIISGNLSSHEGNGLCIISYIPCGFVITFHCFCSTNPTILTILFNLLYISY